MLSRCYPNESRAGAGWVKGEKTSVNWVACHRCMHFHWSALGKWTRIQVRGSEQASEFEPQVTVCQLKAFGGLECVCGCGFVFFLYLTEHFTPRSGSESTPLWTWCSPCDQVTWDWNNIIPFSLTGSRTETRSANGEGQPSVVDWIHWPYWTGIYDRNTLSPLSIKLIPQICFIKLFISHLCTYRPTMNFVKTVSAALAFL